MDLLPGHIDSSFFLCREKALAVTKHQGLQPAMDWYNFTVCAHKFRLFMHMFQSPHFISRLLTHQDDPDIDDPLPEGHKLSDSTQPAPTTSTAAAEQPKSLKCDE